MIYLLSKYYDEAGYNKPGTDNNWITSRYKSLASLLRYFVKPMRFDGHYSICTYFNDHIYGKPDRTYWYKFSQGESKMRYSVKFYFCPLCGRDQSIGTNHTGEVYSGCNSCHSSVMYCKDEQALRDSWEYETATVRHYWLALDEEAEADEYAQLKSQLEMAGLKPFNASADTMAMREYKQLDGQQVKLYKPFQWEQQFVSDKGRLFSWREFWVPNRLIKVGYWLDRNRAKDRL